MTPTCDPHLTPTSHTPPLTPHLSHPTSHTPLVLSHPTSRTPLITRPLVTRPLLQGALRKAGTDQWTLTSFLDYRGTKEFVLEAPPEPHSKFVQVDPSAARGLINFMISIGFQSKRLGILYGKWTTDADGSCGVEVHAVYEPMQESSAETIQLLDDEQGEARIAALAAMLGLSRVGVMIAHPAREYAFSVDEIRLAAKLHQAALVVEPEKALGFVTMKARPVLQHEEIEGVATMEAYQLTDQCIALCEADAFVESASDPRVAKTSNKECVFLVEKRPQRKATMESFITRVFDIGRPFNSFLGTGFVIENRSTEPQNGERMAQYLRSRRSRKEPFLTSVSDLHLLFFLCNMLDMAVDMPVLCSRVVMQQGDELDGFRMMINCYAGID